MKQIDQWKPSKFVISGQRLIPSDKMGLSSKRMAQYVASFYTEYLPKHCSGKLLDLGCGNVPMYAFYKNFVTDVTCVDWGFSLHKQVHLDLECNLNEKIPLPDQSFNTIIMSDVIEHLTEPLLTLKEIERMLLPGGKLLINYPFMYGLHEVPFDYCRYTHFFIEQLCLKAGLTTIESVQFGSSLDVIENLVLKSIKRKKGGRFLEKIFYSVIKLFNRPRLTKIRGDKFTSTPFGYGFVITKPLPVL